MLLAGNKLLSEMYLRQPASIDKSGFTYSACWPFAKHKKRMQKFKETRDSRYIYQNQLDKASFEHGMA